MTPLAVDQTTAAWLVSFAAVYLTGASHFGRLARRVNAEDDGATLTGIRYVAYVGSVSVGWPLVVIAVFVIGGGKRWLK